MNHAPDSKPRELAVPQEPASARSPRIRGTGPTSRLTPAERRVAELVCAGHSRSTIAETLFVSINTVSTHLRSAYAKLHVNSRMQLLLVLHGPSPR